MGYAYLPTVITNTYILKHLNNYEEISVTVFSIDTNEYMWFYNIYKRDAFDVTQTRNSLHL